MTWWLTTALSNAAVVTLLAPFVWLVSRRLQRSALTHALWALLLVKLVAPPLVSVPLPWSIEVRHPAVAALLALPLPMDAARRGVRESAATSAATSGAGESLWKRSWRLRTRDVLQVAVWSWLAGSVLLLAGVARQTLRFQRSITSTQLPHCELQAEVNALCRELRLRRGPTARFTDRAVSPMLWGVGPCVWLVFPRALWEQLERAERRSLVIHELGHVARRDPWVRLLELTVSVLFWWHPIVWSARREIERSAEECCDALVLDWNESPRTYADAIVATLGFLADLRPGLPALASGVSDVPGLKLRLTQILRRTVAPRLSPRARYLVLAWCIGTLVLHPFLPLVPPAG